MPYTKKGETLVVGSFNSVTSDSIAYLPHNSYYIRAHDSSSRFGTIGNLGPLLEMARFIWVFNNFKTTN